MLIEVNYNEAVIFGQRYYLPLNEVDRIDLPYGILYHFDSDMGCRVFTRNGKRHFVSNSDCNRKEPNLISV